MKYFKLVRDKIPEIIKKDKKIPLIHNATEKEFIEKLYEKLKEEVDEFIESKDKEEIADIVEVLDSICSVNNISVEELNRIKENKNIERGSFNNKVILEEVIEPIIHSAMIIKNKNNEILFIKRSINKKTLPGVYSFPSGTKKETESIEDASVRESKEELNLDIIETKIISEIFLEEFGVNLYFVLCKTDNYDFKILEPNEIDSVHWITFNDFFNKFKDDEIGHGLIWLRKHPEIWKNI